MDKLKQYITDEFNTYYEPFIGGGALLFELSPKKTVIDIIFKNMLEYKKYKFKRMF